MILMTVSGIDVRSHLFTNTNTNTITITNTKKGKQ
jgi:hypothetical protein